MADEELEQGASFEDTDNTDVVSQEESTSSDKDDGRVSVGVEETPGQKEQKSLVDLFKSEEARIKGPTPEQQDQSPFRNADGYFASQELAKIRALPLELQNIVGNMMDRVAEVGEQRVKALEGKAALGEAVSKAAGGIEDYVKDQQYAGGTAEYLEHLLSWDKELRENPLEALATVIFDQAGSSVERLQWFTGQLAKKIYDLRDRVYLANNDYATQRQIAAAKEGKKYQAEYTANHENDVRVLKNAAEEARREAMFLFATEKDKYGKPTHPFLKEVGTKMAQLLEKGAVSDLEEAYQMAVAANPKVKKLMQQTRPSLSLTNSPAETSSTDNGQSLNLRQAWEQSRAELGF